MTVLATILFSNRAWMGPIIVGVVMLPARCFGRGIAARRRDGSAGAAGC